MTNLTAAFSVERVALMPTRLGTIAQECSEIISKGNASMIRSHKLKRIQAHSGFPQSTLTQAKKCRATIQNWENPAQKHFRNGRPLQTTRPPNVSNQRRS